MNSDWKTKIMNDYLEWRKAEETPTTQKVDIETIMKEERSKKLKAYHEKKREDNLRDNPLYYEERKGQQQERDRERHKAYRETHRDKLLESQKKISRLA